MRCGGALLALAHEVGELLRRPLHAAAVERDDPAAGDQRLDARALAQHRLARRERGRALLLQLVQLELADAREPLLVLGRGLGQRAARAADADDADHAGSLPHPAIRREPDAAVRRLDSDSSSERGAGVEPEPQERHFNIQIEPAGAGGGVRELRQRQPLRLRVHDHVRARRPRRRGPRGARASRSCASTSRRSSCAS